MMSFMSRIALRSSLALANQSARATVVRSSACHREHLQLLVRSICTSSNRLSNHDYPKPNDPKFGGSPDIVLNRNVNKPGPGPKTAEQFANPEKDGNWVSYGFDFIHKDEDRFITHFIFFIMISGLIVGIGFYYYYIPDMKLDDWCQREAFLIMDQRKKKGLPYVSPDYVHLDRIKLPTEETIGEQDVIL